MQNKGIQKSVCACKHMCIAYEVYINIIYSYVIHINV